MTTIVEACPDVPALEPENTRRPAVREWRRELAGWLRAYGIAATGAAWDAAVCGERDPVTLRRLAADCGGPAALVGHWSGDVLPGALAAGDTLTSGTVAGVPLTDPDTGAVWVVCTRASSGTDHDTVPVRETVTDLELRPDVPVHVTRGRSRRTA